MISGVVLFGVVAGAMASWIIERAQTKEVE